MFAVVGVSGQVRKVLELTDTVDLIDEGAGMELIRRFTQSDATATNGPRVARLTVTMDDDREASPTSATPLNS